MFVSTFPTFPLRTLPVRYGVRTASAPTSFRRGSFARSATPAVSGGWADDAYELTADLPGIPDESVAVSVAGRTLTIDVTTDELTWNERIRLPQTLDPEQVAARYVNGRLTVTIGKTAEAAPRTIAIDTVTAASAPAQAELAQASEAVATEASVTE
jgi:HSP20 family protein